MQKKGGESEAIILVQATSAAGQKHNEGICCTGVTPDGEWVRLYPLTFKRPEDAQKFGRWTRIKFEWRNSPDDLRPETRLIEKNSVEVIGELSQSERHDFITKLEVNGLKNLSKQGKSLALLRPRNPHFFFERKTNEEFQEEQQRYDLILQEKKASGAKMPLKPCPYKFKYKYSTDDGDHEGLYQDWGINATFENLSKSYGEGQTLSRIAQIFGNEYLKKGMVFAVGTDSLAPETWLIDAIIHMDEVYNTVGFQFDFVV